MKKVLDKHPNARECFVCGWENDMGLHARFYEVEGNELVAVFTPDPMHQGFPGRVHGGICATVLDELIGRCLQIGDPDNWAVTVELNVKYKKPVPYGVELKAVGRITKDTRLLAEGTGEIYTPEGDIAVTAKAKYMKLDITKIADEELNEDDWKVLHLEDDKTEV